MTLVYLMAGLGFFGLAMLFVAFADRLLRSGT